MPDPGYTVEEAGESSGQEAGGLGTWHSLFPDHIPCLGLMEKDHLRSVGFPTHKPCANPTVPSPRVQGPPVGHNQIFGAL